MIRIHRFALLLAIAAALAACKPKPETSGPSAEPGESASDDTSSADAAPALALLDACKITMSLPEAHEWQTKWDPAHTRTASQNPSGVRSVHWANEQEHKSANEMNNAIPLDLVCSSDEDARPRIAISITAFDSTVADIPRAPGKYLIAPKASPNKNKPGEFIVGVGLFGEGMFAAKSGTLELTRFDAQGAAGSFVIDGNEILMGSRPVHIEGTFDIPCRKGLLQGACQSDKAEQP